MERAHHIRFALFALISVCTAPSAFASYGNLKGELQNELGQALPNILVTLMRTSSPASLPVLARSDRSGEIFVRNIETGSYEVQIKSTQYRSPGNPIVKIEAGQTALFTLVLQQFFGLPGSDGQNVSLKSLLRTGPERRLIFRELPGLGGERASQEQTFQPFQNAVFQVYTSSGLDGDYLIFPADSSSGATTSFAFTDTLAGNSKYIFAGQLNSGEDSLWRLKNLIQYELSQTHSVQLFLGYGRTSFEQPSLTLMGDPLMIGDNLSFINAVGTVKMLSAGLQDQWRWGDTLALVWGLELNQVRTPRSHSFASPSAQITFSPTSSTTLSATLAAKRPSQGNTLMLPEGETVNLADAVHFSRLGNRFTLGTSRHYRTSISQKFEDHIEVEFAAYRSHLFGGSVPVLAVFSYQPGVEVLQLDGEHAEEKGYRATVRRALGENVKAAVSYIRGSGLGVAKNNVTLAFSEPALKKLLNRYDYHAFSTQLEAAIPHSQTQVMALLKLVPGGNPLTTLDTFSDVYEVSNKGVNLFIRQLIPVPLSLLNFLGLDFLGAYKIEALLDIRNLTNEDLGLIRTALGDVLLVRNPRTVRGGISLKF